MDKIKKLEELLERAHNLLVAATDGFPLDDETAIAADELGDEISEVLKEPDDEDLISRASLLAGIAELKESPWYNFGKADGMILDGMEAMWYYGYLQRKEAVEIIEDMCIKKEPAQSVHQGTWLFNTHTEVFPWKCSKCNYDTVARFNFCPNCGARMDGDNG